MSGAVHVVVPDSIDDPARPSGGNHYDRRVIRELTGAGWQLTVHPVAGSWPRPEAAAVANLGRLLADIPDGAVTLLDGLVASIVPELLVPQAARLRLVVLIHLPLGLAQPDGTAPDPATMAGEAAVLAAAAAVLVTSRWTRQRLLELYPQLPPAAVQVAEPGVDPAAPAAGSADGGELLCVASVTHGKGHDLLLAALAGVAELRWRCDWVGSLDREPDFVARLRAEAESTGLTDRIRLRGPLTGAALEQAYASADALVLASRVETYGMVVTEALARGLPVLATAVGGLPTALGQTTDGRRPGLLVPAEDPGALSTALRDWLTDAELRQRLRLAAAERRGTLTGWAVTGRLVGQVLSMARAG
ncbi:MAG TPA: glycosyltransferase family 4 protein [Jatrophihabitans sp.]|nr:glycosyltransferase family 4 protein [Jatrophihabitans sp.]